MHSLVALISIVACSYVFSVEAHAVESVATATNRLMGIQEQIKRLRLNLQEAEGRAGKLQTQLATTEIEIGRINKQLREANHRKAEFGTRLSSLKNDQSATLKNLSKQRSTLICQLQMAYVIGKKEKVKLLLNQQDPSSIGRTMMYYQYITKSRAQQISRFNAALSTLQMQTDEINKETAKLHLLITHLKYDQQNLKRYQTQRNKVLIAQKQQINRQSESLNSVLKDEHRLQLLIKSLQMALADIPNDVSAYQPFAQSKGQLEWPVKGQIRNLFGKNRINHTDSLKWQGIVIESEIGQGVRAISSGRIAFSDWLPRYGLITIIDHGHGYMSLYGHNQSLYRSAGDWVETGDLIAIAGNSGGQESPGLYFEIRYRGKPLDPALWCSSGTQISATSPRKR
jgi:septal ring factor EnvC (AmiA/AmiB activator)